MSKVTTVDRVDVHHLPVVMLEEDTAKYVAALRTDPCYVEVLNCTAQFVLDYICSDQRFSNEAQYIRSYVEAYGNYSSKSNVWTISMQPLMRAAINYIIHCENKSLKLRYRRAFEENVVQSAVADDGEKKAREPENYKVALVVSLFLAPSIDPSCDIFSTLTECYSFMETGAPCRGIGPCIRGGAVMAPESFSFILNTINGPEWRVCELPSNSHMCAMVMFVTGERQAEARMFRKNTGEIIGGVVNLVRTQDSPAALGKVSVFECSYNPLTDSVKIIDCAKCNGVCVKQMSLTNRVAAAANEAALWRVGPHMKSIVVVAYSPPMSLINQELARRVLFVREGDPYDLRVGSSAFLWKQPSLDGPAGHTVLICRNHECMAAETYKSCMLASVGRCCSEIPRQMGCYVCVPNWDENAWVIIREAKRSERLFTLEEAASSAHGYVVTTQITRAGMVRLLNQVGGVRVPSSAPVKIPVEKSPKAQFPSDPEGREKREIAKKKAPSALTPKKAAPTKPVAPTTVFNAFAVLDADVCSEKKLMQSQTKHKKH